MFQRFTKFALFFLIGMVVVDVLDYVFHFDFMFSRVLDWDNIAIYNSFFIEYLRLAKRSMVLAMGCGQILALNRNCIRYYCNIDLKLSENNRFFSFLVKIKVVYLHKKTKCKRI